MSYVTNSDDRPRTPWKPVTVVLDSDEFAASQIPAPSLRQRELISKSNEGAAELRKSAAQQAEDDAQREVAIMGETCRCGRGYKMDRQRVCLLCHNEYQKKWIAAHPLTSEQRLRNLARSQVHKAIKRGEIIPQSCEICGEKAHPYHHDYSKPKLVRWFCRACRPRFMPMVRDLI